jgi:hypothetical protein
MTKTYFSDDSVLEGEAYAVNSTGCNYFCAVETTRVRIKCHDKRTNRKFRIITDMTWAVRGNILFWKWEQCLAVGSVNSGNRSIKIQFLKVPVLRPRLSIVLGFCILDLVLVTMFIRSQVSCDDCHDPCAVFL